LELLKSNRNTISCIVRKKLVACTPEELVRQAMLSHLSTNLHYPLSLITVEKQLQEWAGQAVPDRRLDILCFGKDEKNTLRPLLLIECKRHKPNKAHLLQLLGYNFYIQAPYIAVVGPEDILFRAQEKQEKDYAFIPRYDELVHASKGKDTALD
jgi:hypothetical protein